MFLATTTLGMPPVSYQSRVFTHQSFTSLNIDATSARQARHRFTSHFGPLNQHITVRNHTLVMLDAAGLVEEDYLRAARYIDYDHWTPLPRGPVEFVHSLKDEGALRTGVALAKSKLIP